MLKLFFNSRFVLRCAVPAYCLKSMGNPSFACVFIFYFLADFLKFSHWLLINWRLLNFCTYRISSFNREQQSGELHFCWKSVGIFKVSTFFFGWFANQPISLLGHQFLHRRKYYLWNNAYQEQYFCWPITKLE